MLERFGYGIQSVFGEFYTVASAEEQPTLPVLEGGTRVYLPHMEVYRVAPGPVGALGGYDPVPASVHGKVDAVFIPDLGYVRGPDGPKIGLERITYRLPVHEVGGMEYDQTGIVVE